MAKKCNHDNYEVEIVHQYTSTVSKSGVLDGDPEPISWVAHCGDCDFYGEYSRRNVPAWLLHYISDAVITAATGE